MNSIPGCANSRRISHDITPPKIAAISDRMMYIVPMSL